MEPNKYSRLIEILANIREENAETLSNKIKFLFKNFIFGDKEIRTFHELWFEGDEIQTDKEYYQLIQSLIDTFINHFSDEKSFKEELLVKEIISILRNTKYFCSYR